LKHRNPKKKHNAPFRARPDERSDIRGLTLHHRYSTNQMGGITARAQASDVQRLVEQIVTVPATFRGTSTESPDGQSSGITAPRMRSASSEFDARKI
jgi:hypothetical protein